MNFRILGCAAALLLSGCSSLPSMDSLLTFNHDEAAQDAFAPAAEVTAAAPVPAAPPAGDMCKNAAANARTQAAADGFDAATQDRMAQQGYVHCTLVSGRG